ncbi:MAG: tetratricopeptide repeat protein [Candidatus Rokuibacteriota bacterium]
MRPWPVLLLWDLLLAGFCVFSVYVQFAYRVPGHVLLTLLPWLGIVLTALSLLGLVNLLLRRAPLDEPIRQALQRAEQLCSYVIVAFCLYSTVLFVNGLFSRGGAVHVAQIVEIGGGEIDLGPVTSFSWVTLRSWRSPGRAERLLLHADERQWLWGGLDVLVHVRHGRFGIPWVSRVEPNGEKILLAVLEATPTAAEPRRRLAHLYVRSHRYDDARITALRHLELYPRDEAFAVRIATELLYVARQADAVPILEPFAKLRPRHGVYTRLGFALGQTGRRREGIELLQKAIALWPDDWWTYNALGYVHYWAAEFDRAIPLFEKVLELRPNSPEIRDVLRRARALAAEQERQLKAR